MPEKVLLIGARGYLGSFVVKYAPEDVKLIISARDRRNLPDGFEFIPIDITDKDSTVDKISDLRPDIIINCAANSLPDVAEEKKEWTYAVNVEGVKNLIVAAGKADAKLIQLSTDYVFSGDKGLYTEEDEPRPINYYGYTKLEAERALMSSDIEYLICRTSVLYGLKRPYHRRVLFYSVYETLKKGEIFRATVQIASPTLVDDLAICLYKIRHNPRSEIFHTCCGIPLSRYEFAVAVAEKFGFDKSLIKLVEKDSRKAPRPRNSSLSTAKLNSRYPDIGFRDVKTALDFIAENLDNPNFFPD